MKGSGKEASQGGGAVSSIYELQSTDAKGNQERILLQKTDKSEELDHQKFECNYGSPFSAAIACTSSSAPFPPSLIGSTAPGGSRFFFTLSYT